MKTLHWLTVTAALIVILASCGAPAPPLPFTPAAPETRPSQPTPAAPVTPVPGDPYSFISQESLLATVEDLTEIEPYSGWRGSATVGEAAALDYVEGRLAEMAFLQELGLELERQSFHAFLATELWDTHLELTVDGATTEVPADGLRGHRDDIALSLRFDSDGTLNDADPDPVSVEGPVIVVRSEREINRLSAADLADAIVFLDYAAIDRTQLGRDRATEVVADLLAKEPAGLVLVTQFSNQPGESHGTFVGDVSVLSTVEGVPAPPTLYARLEDLGPAGITDWDDLANIETAHMTWDADVFSPADSANLAARIPGSDPSRAVILSAHIDSPNSPGALDDGSGSAILLEIARALNEARVQPPTDVYLVWFGSEELGLYGSYHFASTHQELLDRTMAVLQTDMLGYPLNGIDAYLNLVTWSYGRLGDSSLTWPDYMVAQADRQGTWVYPVNYYGIESDSTAFAGFNVPHANFIYMDSPAMEHIGGVHYGTHIHDPYDTVELVRELGSVFEQMARVVLAAALETGEDDPLLRVTPSPDRRAVFVASHTEAVQMSPTTFTELGMSLAWEGFDVDLVPYGQSVTAADLADADLVVVLPIVDYPSPDGDPDLYDDDWSTAEVDALAAYAEEGGLLVLTNSAHRLKYANWVMDPNEDWADANDLAARFGVTFQQGPLGGRHAQVDGGGSLLEGMSTLAMAEDNGVPFIIDDGEVLARIGSDVAAALVEHGSGEVLILADAGMLGSDGGEPVNLPFWLNLARYARSR